ncbi:MAG TPA: cyclase family protein [Thermoanaerobaculia bacterium]|nr:cyclase family protein [Thermoanaerobaculia bacterium]
MPRATLAAPLTSLGALALLVACAAPPPAPPAPAGSSLAELEPVDLTHTYDGSTLYWPTATTRFEHHQEAFGPTEGGWFYSAYSFSTPEHGGTHLDAPIHFAEGAWTVDRIPVERLVVPAVVIDVSVQSEADPDYRLTADDVTAWEAEHGTVPAGAAVLLRTGWARYWPDAETYLGDDTPGDASNLHFPSFGLEAARLLIEERGVAMLGVDTASIDHGPSADFPVHRLAGAANVPGLENVASLERVPATGAWLVALPMKIGGGSGGPVRIVALVPRAGARNTG